MRVTPEWLHERGGLHDARVRDIRRLPDHLELEIDDEWANERNDGSDKSPGILQLANPNVLKGETAGLSGGWISEVQFTGDKQLQLDFCDRNRVVIAVARIDWAPKR